MPRFKNILISLAPRILGSALAGIATYIGVKTSGAVQIDPAQAAEVVTGIFVSYAAGHRALSSQVNPGDASTGRLAAAEKQASDTGSTVVVSPSTH